MDSVKQSAALCLLRLYKASPDLVPMGEWTARVVHLLNDQHMVSPLPSRLLDARGSTSALTPLDTWCSPLGPEPLDARDSPLCPDPPGCPGLHPRL